MMLENRYFTFAPPQTRKEEKTQGRAVREERRVDMEHGLISSVGVTEQHLRKD